MAYRLTIEQAIRPEGEGWVSRYPRREPAGQPPEAHIAICLHYDASSSDAGSLAWFRDPAARNRGYTYLVLDSGRTVQLAPYDAWVYHAGICRPSEALMRQGCHYRDANRALVGVSIAATDGEQATPLQILAVAAICADVFRRESWGADELWRVTGHDLEAWPRGRKQDPTGSDPAHPVLDPELVRMVARGLLASDAA